VFGCAPPAPDVGEAPPVSPAGALPPGVGEGVCSDPGVEGEPPPNEPEPADADAELVPPLPHSRCPIERSTIEFAFAMSRASARLPYSHVVRVLFIPMTRSKASRTRPCTHVKATPFPTGNRDSAERSANVNPVKKREDERATCRAPPRSSVFWSTMNMNIRPIPTPSLVLIAAGSDGVPTSGRTDATSMNSAVTTRRGWPPTLTMKSAGRRPRTGSPCLSTTPTSTETISTPLRNAGTCSGRT
jgi:hypothetical protein